jgi:hypothetical protein
MLPAGVNAVGKRFLFFALIFTVGAWAGGPFRSKSCERPLELRGESVFEWKLSNHGRGNRESHEKILRILKGAGFQVISDEYVDQGQRSSIRVHATKTLVYSHFFEVPVMGYTWIAPVTETTANHASETSLSVIAKTAQGFADLEGFDENLPKSCRVRILQKAGEFHLRMEDENGTEIAAIQVGEQDSISLVSDEMPDGSFEKTFFVAGKGTLTFVLADDGFRRVILNGKDQEVNCLVEY